MISIIDPRDLRQVLRPTVYATSLDELRRNIAAFVARETDADDRQEPAA